MELALLTGANPRVCSDGPRVRLAAGHWRFEQRGVTDSVVSVLVHDESGIPAYHVVGGEHTELITPHGRTVQAVVSVRGSESSVSVVAVKLAGATT